ncbi:MAG: type IV secretion system protein [Janthinobacterium lividum]
MNLFPFTAIDTEFGAAFGIYLSSTMNSILAGIAGPLTLLVTLWVIVQGILVIRGDMDARRGVIRIVRLALVVGLVLSSGYYAYYVQSLFVTVLPNYIAGLTGGMAHFAGIPTSLDTMLIVSEAELNLIGAEIIPSNAMDEAAFQHSQFILIGTLWTAFSIYEITSIMTQVLVAIGPLFVICYLFDFTKPIAERWVGQLINYTILFLLINVVLTVIVVTESAYLTIELAAIAFSGPTALQIADFFDLDLFLMTGDLIIVTLPLVAAVLGGGANGGPGNMISSMGVAQSMKRTA